MKTRLKSGGRTEDRTNIETSCEEFITDLDCRPVINSLLTLTRDVTSWKLVRVRAFFSLG